jgi:glyceraldehyde 3-phosphate dehydrogenase
MKRIAINGFGRIGRASLKVILKTTDLEVVAVNDLMSIENAAYLFKYDSVYGVHEGEVSFNDNHLLINGKKIQYLSQKDPAQLPWKELAIDAVIESTGFFTLREDAEKHIQAGAKYVVISAPTKSKETPTVLHGVNRADGKTDVFSCASCTTNNIGPVLEIIDRRIGIRKAVLNTIHAYTASQSLVDAPAKRDLRAGRAAAINLVPASTGAVVAATRVLPQLEGKFDGLAIRTPVPVGSISDITFVTARNTAVEEINKILTEESQTDRYRKVLSVTDQPLVSSDVLKSSFASIVDLKMTRVVDGDLVKIMAWYDNEWGFTNQMIRELQSL